MNSTPYASHSNPHASELHSQHAQPRAHHDTIRYAIGAAAVLAVLISGGTAGADATLPDAAGDAQSGPDLVQVTGAYDHTRIYLSAHFKAGSLDRRNVAFEFGLDLDRNPFTGMSPTLGWGFPLGAEATIDFNTWRDSGQARVAVLTRGDLGGSVSVQFHEDRVTLEIPWSMVGSKPAPAHFGAVVGVPTLPTYFVVSDVVPDSAWKGPLGGPLAIREGPAVLTVRVSEVEITWNSQTGRRYVVEQAAAVSGGTWVPLGSPLPGTGGLLRIADRVEEDEPRRIYRVREVE